MSKYDASHDFKHVLRVLHLSLHIANTEQDAQGRTYDLSVIKLATLLHDVGDRKYAEPDDPQDPVYRFLNANGAEETLARKVQEIVDHVSFSKEKKNPQAVQEVLTCHPELAVVQDADRLDALGAIGIARCFTFSASQAARNLDTSTPLASPEKSGSVLHSQSCMDDAIAHFGAKLLHLESMMKTETGRKLARQRTERLTMFRDWFLEEQE